MLVHNAARALPAETTAKVAAVLNFGDPCKFTMSTKKSIKKLTILQSRDRPSRASRLTGSRLSATQAMVFAPVLLPSHPTTLPTARMLALLLILLPARCNKRYFVNVTSV